jgi:hypothetical protein
VLGPVTDLEFLEHDRLGVVAEAPGMAHVPSSR